MALTLAGYGLPLATDEILDFLQATIPPSHYCPWLRRSWPGYGLVGLTWPVGFWLEHEFRFNHLYWPNGASRWAFGHFFADAQTTDAIRSEAFGQDGSGQNAIELYMDSPSPASSVQGQNPEQEDSPENLTANVYLLPPYPLSAVPTPGDGSINNAYLLTVVDQRYYWWYKQTPLVQFDSIVGVSWSEAFDIAQTQLGIDIDVDEISSKYLNASPALNLSYEVLPPWLDALAFNVNQRIVVAFDGSVSTQNYRTALDALNDDLSDNPDRIVRAGGYRFQDTIF
jgi:hypothetical protein